MRAAGTVAAVAGGVVEAPTATESPSMDELGSTAVPRGTVGKVVLGRRRR